MLEWCFGLGRGLQCCRVCLVGGFSDRDDRERRTCVLS